MFLERRNFYGTQDNDFKIEIRNTFKGQKNTNKQDQEELSHAMK